MNGNNAVLTLKEQNGYYIEICDFLMKKVLGNNYENEGVRALLETFETSTRKNSMKNEEVADAENRSKRKRGNTGSK